MWNPKVLWNRARTFSCRKFASWCAPWLLSFATNLTGVLICAFISIVILAEREPISYTARFHTPQDDFEEPLAPLEITTSNRTNAALTSAAVQSEMEIPTATTPVGIDKSILRDDSTSTTGPLSLFGAASGKSENRGKLFGLPTGSDLSTIVPSSSARGPVTEKELRDSKSVDDVVVGLADDFREKLATGDLFIVWAMDASLSLLDDRLMLAERVEKLQADLQREFEIPKKKKLLQSIIAYGDGTRQITESSAMLKKATIAMRTMPTDPSGRETVLSAIAWGVLDAREKVRFRGNLMVVVFTDESGDDLELLEQTIELCRYYKASVSVIGPTAVLGTEEGFHRWWFPPLGKHLWLPIDRGPDAAIPERISIPYWWSTEALDNRFNLPQEIIQLPDDEHKHQIWEAKLPVWARGAEVLPGDYFTGSYSGRELINLNSGFPPYSLMRLARETKGTYTMYDGIENRGPFRMSIMKPYIPDYRTVGEQLMEINGRPLREAILGSAMLTQYERKREMPWYSFGDCSIRPAGFHAYCQGQFANCDRIAEENAKMVETALQLFGPNGLEGEYEKETSARWRAWYDLNYGRLLLQSVRYAEYRMIIRMLLDERGFPEGRNYILLGPMNEIRTGPVSIARAAEGKRLLERCLEKNAGTPWAFLAARELEHPVGIGSRYDFIPECPPPRGGGYVPSGPSISIPSL